MLVLTATCAIVRVERREKKGSDPVRVHCFPFAQIKSRLVHRGGSTLDSFSEINGIVLKIVDTTENKILDHIYVPCAERSEAQYLHRVFLYLRDAVQTQNESPEARRKRKATARAERLRADNPFVEFVPGEEITSQFQPRGTQLIEEFNPDEVNLSTCVILTTYRVLEYQNKELKGAFGLGDIVRVEHLLSRGTRLHMMSGETHVVGAFLDGDDQLLLSEHAESLLYARLHPPHPVDAKPVPAPDSSIVSRTSSFILDDDEDRGHPRVELAAAVRSVAPATEETRTYSPSELHMLASLDWSCRTHVYVALERDMQGRPLVLQHGTRALQLSGAASSAQRPDSAPSFFELTLAPLSDHPGQRWRVEWTDESRTTGLLTPAVAVSRKGLLSPPWLETTPLCFDAKSGRIVPQPGKAGNAQLSLKSIQGFKFGACPGYSCAGAVLAFVSGDNSFAEFSRHLNHDTNTTTNTNTSSLAWSELEWVVFEPLELLLRKCLWPAVYAGGMVRGKTNDLLCSKVESKRKAVTTCGLRLDTHVRLARVEPATAMPQDVVRDLGIIEWTAWQPDLGDEKDTRVCFGHVLTAHGDHANQPTARAVLTGARNSPAFASPIGFALVCVGLDRVCIWEPVPPHSGFVALGLVATASDSAPTVHDLPDIRVISRELLGGVDLSFRCVATLPHVSQGHATGPGYAFVSDRMGLFTMVSAQASRLVPSSQALGTHTAYSWPRFAHRLNDGAFAVRRPALCRSRSLHSLFASSTASAASFHVV